MAGSSLSSDPLTSPSPSPSPPPGTTKPTESSGAGLDSDSELSELTEEEQEAQKRKVKQGARPVRQLARQTLSRNRTQRRAGGRRKTSSLVPTPMWGWAESKASNTAEEEEEEEDDDEEGGSVNRPPKVLEEEEDENEHDIGEDEEEDGSVVTPRSGAAKRLVPENDPTNHNDDERRENDEHESRAVNGVDDDDASEDEKPVHRIAQKPKPNPPWGTRPRAPFSAQQHSHHSQSLVNGQSDAVPSEETAFGAGDHEPDADERENDVDDGSDADPDAADEALTRGGSESENGVESEEEEEDSKGIRADDDEPDGGAPPASAKTKASKLTSQSTDVLVDMDVDITAPAPQDIAPLAAAAAASSIMAGSAVLDPPSPSATSASGSAASSRSASPVPSAKVSDREGGNEKPAGRPKRDAKSGAKMEEDASHAAIPASAKGNAIAAANNETEVEPERSVVDEAELDEHSPDDDLEVEIESDLQPAHRAEALDVLATIELKFALLRERVYVEKMEGLAWEEQLIGEGTHPELIHLQKELSKRRDKRLELAARKRAYELGTVAKRRRADDDATWSWWKLARDELQTDMISETNRKRRKLERERRAVERPLPLRRLPNIPQEVPPPPSLRKIARTFPPDHRRQNKHHLGANHLTYPELSTLSAAEVASDLDFLLQPRDRRPAYDLHHSSSMNINPQLSQQPPHTHAYEQYNDGMMQNSYGSSATHRMPPPPFQQHHVPPSAPPMPGYPSYNGPPPQGRMHQPSHVPQPPPLHGHVHHHGQPPHSIDQDVGAMPGSSQALAHPYFGSQGGAGQGGYPGGPPPPPAPSHAMGRPTSPVMTNGSTGKMRGMPGFGGAMTTLYAIRRNAGDRGRDGRRPPDMVADDERDEAYWEQERRWLVEESEKEREREWEREMERRDRENREREREEEMERQRQYHNHQQQQLSQQQQPHRHAPPSSHHHHPIGPGQSSHHHLNPHMHHRSQPHHHHVVHHHHGHSQSGNSIGHGSSSLPPNGPGSGVPRSPRGSRDYDIARPHSHAGINQHPTEVINLSSTSKSSLWKGDEHSPPSGDYRDGRKHPARPSSGPVLDDRDRPMAIPFALGPSPHSMPGSGMSPPTGPAMNGTSSPRSTWNPSTDDGPYRMPPNAPGSAGPHSYLGSHEGHVHSPGQRYASAAPSSSHMNRGPPPPSSRQNSLGLSPPRGRPMHPPSPSSSSAYPNSTNSHHSPTRYGQSPSLLPPNRSPPVSLKMRPPSPLSNKMMSGPPPPPPLSSSSSAGPAFSPHLSGPGRTLTPTGLGPQQPTPPSLPPSSSLDAKNGLIGPPPYPHVDSRTASPHHMSYPPSAGHPSLPPPSTLSSRGAPPPPLGPVTNGPGAGALLDQRERERDRERDVMMDRERERMGGGPSSAMSSPRLGILPPSASLPPPPSKMSVPQMVDGH